jgi:hypothetical protein
MRKLLLFFGLLYVGCVMCGGYGALHNQISYTISPALFDLYFFPQFDTPLELRNRIGASLVGWQASWWMGLIVGAPILLVGLLIPGSKAYLTRCLFAFGLVTATTVIVGLGALVYADSTLPEHSAIDRAEMMHGGSYLGGFLGILTGSVFLVAERVRIGLATRKQAEADLAPNAQNHS